MQKNEVWSKEVLKSKNAILTEDRILDLQGTPKDW